MSVSGRHLAVLKGTALRRLRPPSVRPSVRTATDTDTDLLLVLSAQQGVAGGGARARRAHSAGPQRLLPARHARRLRAAGGQRLVRNTASGPFALFGKNRESDFGEHWRKQRKKSASRSSISRQNVSNDFSTKEGVFSRRCHCGNTIGQFSSDKLLHCLLFTIVFISYFWQLFTFQTWIGLRFFFQEEMLPRFSKHKFCATVFVQITIDFFCLGRENIFWTTCCH